MNDHDPEGVLALPTKRLYYDNPYLKEFSCNVISCTGPLSTYNSSTPVYQVVTDETGFYPESGGQPSDKGVLSGVKVIDVQELDDSGEIAHITTSALPCGPAFGRIDLDRRLDHMQQHTGQHILSAAFERLFELSTVGFHLGENIVTIDLDTSSLTEDQCAAAERMACEAVFHNHPITTGFYTSDEVEEMNLRKKPVSKGMIRIVKIDDFDTCACCGTHLSRTGEVGIIKIIGHEKVKGLTRVEFVCGRRALSDYGWKNMVLSQTSEMLSVHPKDLQSSIIKMQNQYKEMKRHLDNVTSELLTYQANDIYSKAELDPFISVRIICRTFDDVDFDALKLTANKVCQNPNVVTIFCSKADGAARLVLHRSEDLSLDVNQVLKEILPVISGKGGGSPIVAQCGTKELESLDTAISYAVKLIREKLAPSSAEKIS